MLPPNEHPLDWFVIPELKGEPVTFIAYTKTGCVCRLCDTDKLTQVELQEHYQTLLHLQKHYQLEERRNELHTLVHQTEQELLAKHHQLLEEEHARTLQTQRRVKDEAVRQEQVQKTKQQLPVRIAASERRAALKGTRDVQKIIRERPMCEDLSTDKSTSDSSTNNGPSQQATTTTSREKIRQLRARRLAAQHHPQQMKNMPTKEEMIKQDKLREKEAKRLEVLETTRRHQQKQKEEDEAARIRAKLEVTAKQKRSSTSLADDFCLGCMSSSFWEETFDREQQ
jgi:hypothetical protein